MRGTGTNLLNRRLGTSSQEQDLRLFEEIIKSLNNTSKKSTYVFFEVRDEVFLLDGVAFQDHYSAQSLSDTADSSASCGNFFQAAALPSTRTLQRRQEQISCNEIKNTKNRNCINLYEVATTSTRGPVDSSIES
ncbi:unnamed protein product, partial [Amoebophrya sp. A120]|eukprot:GSA120T00011155001.1